MRVDNRLAAIIAEIHGENLLDIGCDHGKVLVEALKQGRVKHATGVDISAPSLAKARALAAENCVNADFVLSNGRDVSFDCYDIVVIAGMGGAEITEILKNRVSYPKMLILVPHQGKDTLRKFLNENKLFARKDFTVRAQEKYYDIIVVENGAEPYLDGEIFYGKNTPQSPEFLNKVQARAAAIKALCSGNYAVSDELRGEWEAYRKWLQ